MYTMADYIVVQQKPTQYCKEMIIQLKVNFIERAAVILTGIPLCVICCFSLAAFNICSLCLIFVNLINKLLHNKGNYQQGEKTAFRMGEK